MPTTKPPRSAKPAQTPAQTTTPLPAIGSPLAGGTYAGIVSPADGAPYALILLADKPATRLAWKPATAWAKKLKATLPNRVEGALLFANLGGHFDPSWHWLETQHSESGAWGQYFGYGTQGYGDVKYEGLARAVRRLVLQSFSASVAAS